MNLKFESKSPEVNALFIAPNATLIGDVILGDETSVWFSAVLRADENSITIGEGSNVQDNATIHVTKDNPTVVGSGVTIGHNAVIHACVIEDDCIIGMGAVVLTGALIGSGSIVAAGSVVKEGMVVPPRSLVAGVPAVIKKELGPDALRKIRDNAQEYIALSKKYR